MNKLNPEIVKTLSEKLKKSPATIKKNIYLLVKNHSRCTKNAIAQIYAMEHGATVLRKLDKEDKLSLPNIETRRERITITQKHPARRKEDRIIPFVKYETSDRFRKAHIDEINRTYTYRCYTSAFILCRKVIENLLTDIVRRKYPHNKKEYVELYFDTTRHRIKDSSEILRNLQTRSSDFGQDKKLLERIINRVREFKDDANDKTHSWYHIVRNKKELDDYNVQDIIDMISKLEKNIAHTQN